MIVTIPGDHVAFNLQLEGDGLHDGALREDPVGAEATIGRPLADLADFGPVQLDLPHDKLKAVKDVGVAGLPLETVPQLKPCKQRAVFEFQRKFGLPSRKI